MSMYVKAHLDLSVKSLVGCGFDSRPVHLGAWPGADAVAKRYRPWPKGFRADSLPWFDSPLVQGASRLRYTDKAQMQRPGHTGRKALATKKSTWEPGRGVPGCRGGLRPFCCVVVFVWFLRDFHRNGPVLRFTLSPAQWTPPQLNRPVQHFSFFARRPIGQM